jgi:hypothetical protein
MILTENMQTQNAILKKGLLSFLQFKILQQFQLQIMNNEKWEKLL